MKSKRPVNLNLTTIHFPVTAIISILHRLSGILVFIFVPLLLWLLSQSLSSAENFTNLQYVFGTPWFRFIFWIFLAGIITHFIAGIRHLLMDNHVGESLEGGRKGAFAAIIISIILIVLAGIWLW